MEETDHGLEQRQTQPKEPKGDVLLLCCFCDTLTSLVSSLPAGASMGTTFEIQLLVDIWANWNHRSNTAGTGKHRYWEVVAWIETEK